MRAAFLLAAFLLAALRTLLALALLHHLLGEALRAAAQIVERLALLAQCALAIALQEVVPG